MNPRLEERDWFVLIDRNNRSQMSTHEVRASVQAGTLGPDTLVWRGGMSDWASIRNIAELAAQPSRPAVSRAQPRSGYNPRFAETVISTHRAAQQYRRPPTASSPRLVLALIATGAAVLLTICVTSYALYRAGAFEAGSDRPDADAHAGAR